MNDGEFCIHIGSIDIILEMLFGSAFHFAAVELGESSVRRVSAPHALPFLLTEHLEDLVDQDITVPLEV